MNNTFRKVDDIVNDIMICSHKIITSLLAWKRSQNEPCKQHFEKKADYEKIKRNWLLRELELTQRNNELEQQLEKEVAKLYNSNFAINDNEHY